MSDFAERLAEAKSKSLSQPVIRTARLLTDLGLAVHSSTAPGEVPRPAHMALFPHIALEGTRPTALAERLGITPQAVAQLVRDLERMDLVERRPDPADGRARLVTFTAQGEAFLLRGFTALQRVERDVAAAMGPEDFETLVDLVTKLEGIVAELHGASQT